MAEILRSKNLATKFQILLEIAANQPNIQQRDIAKKLGITSQAISEYVGELISNGWLSSQGRSRYRVTKEGVDWILRMARQLQGYSSFVSKVISDISISTAIADDDLSAGQPVSLYMKDGLLFASGVISDEGARGIAVSEARKGDDVGISNIEGVIKLKTGKVTIGKVPNIQKGGSRNTDFARLKEEISEGALIGAIGVEALVALKQVGIKSGYLYGVKEAAIEATYCGLPFLVLCAEDGISPLVQRLEEENLDYEIVDLRKDVS
jgi:putative transcriptional regulator